VTANGTERNVDGQGVANDGRPHTNSYAWIMRLADGQAVEGTAFYDSISFNDLWNPGPTLTARDPVQVGIVGHIRPGF
jgi:ketosteroid isomerase-like protein